VLAGCLCRPRGRQVLPSTQGPTKHDCRVSGARISGCLTDDLYLLL